jgi:hypothetical protein
MSRHPKTTLALALALCIGVPGCKTKSALDAALEQRARWNVLALDWTQKADHVVLLSTRVNGPVSSSLASLTVRIVLQDASGASIEEIWHTYDLSELTRGGPKDITITIAANGPVEGLGVDRVLNPSEQERSRIAELAGLH